MAVLTFEHTAVAVAAADAGKHVIFEKPLAFHPADGHLILEAARRNLVQVLWAT